VSQFYVYAVAIDGRVKYIGKGKGKRAWTHQNKSHNPLVREAVERAKAKGQQIKTRILIKGLTEYEALKLERSLIVRHHRRLLNVSMGNRSTTEAWLAKLHEEWNCLKSLEQIAAEGEWRGLSVEYRLEIGREIRRFLAEMILEARAKLRLEKQSICYVR
jgi:hypothetical protein